MNHKVRYDLVVIAAIIAVLCVATAYVSRNALSPDGVSYLDLASAARRGDWSHFVQGYWSPLFPFVLGFLGSVGHFGPPQLIVAAHVVNLTACLAAVAVIWSWSEGHRTPAFGRAALAVTLLAGAGLPRLDAVTPDLLLVLIVVLLCREWIVHHGKRWIVVGLLLGAAYLAKTSTWPWMIFALMVQLWSGPDAMTRRRVAYAGGVAAVVMLLLWITPMTLKYGGFTLGSSAHLNYSWYIRSSSSRLPDDDPGNITAAPAIRLPDGRAVTLVTFAVADGWTYEPWGDPTEWSEKVVTDTGSSPTPMLLFRYWLHSAAVTFGLWLSPLALFVLAPLAIMEWRPGMVRELATSSRSAAGVMLLGLGGIVQFMLIHTEPRLIEPFALMLGIGWVAWCCDREPAKQIRPWAVRAIPSFAGIVLGVGFALRRGQDSIKAEGVLANELQGLAQLRATVSSHDTGSEIAIIGAAAPVISHAYRLGLQVAVQIPPSSAKILSTLQQDQARQVLTAALAPRVAIAWQTTGDGTFQALIMPGH